MNRDDLEKLRQFVDKALRHGWNPCHGPIQGTYVVLDPPCVRIAVASPSTNVDNDIYVDWLGPLHDFTLARAAWGWKLVEGARGLEENWRFHQHKLLDLLQTAPKEAYFEYLELAQ